jgi:long-chain acyl-CoA synthetase
VDEVELENWAAENDRSGRPVEDLVTDPALRAEIQAAVDDANRQVSHAEGVKKFVVLPRDFTEDSGELTATLKVKRHVVEQHYAEQIEGMYV